MADETVLPLGMAHTREADRVEGTAVTAFASSTILAWTWLGAVWLLQMSGPPLILAGLFPLVACGALGGFLLVSPEDRRLGKHLLAGTALAVVADWTIAYLLVGGVAIT
jgi:hypothetical protein